MKPGLNALMTHEKAQNKWVEENLLVKHHFLTLVLRDTWTPSRVCKEVQGLGSVGLLGLRSGTMQFLCGMNLKPSF